MYLTELPFEFAGVFPGLIGSEVTSPMVDANESEASNLVLPGVADDLDAWEHRLETQIEADQSVDETRSRP